VAAFFAAGGFLFYRLVQGGAALGWGWVVLTAAIGYVASDLTSGLVHWGFDTWGARDTPVLGANFIVPFRLHHDDPKDITRHGFVATNGHNCFVSLFVMVPAMLLPGAWTVTPAVQAFILFLCLGVFATNQFHKWAHEDEPSAFVKTLQRLHLVLGVEHHEVHHTFPYHRHYCITTGWLNGLLDGIRFFRGLEWLITRVTGAQPRADDLGHTPPPGTVPAAAVEEP